VDDLGFILTFLKYHCPQVLGDLVESLAGAVLVDTQFDTDKVWSIFEPLLQPIVTPDTLHLHPVRELVELCNMRKFKWTHSSLPKGVVRVFKYIVSTGKETIESEAVKPDTKSAKRLAAYEMLGKLKVRFVPLTPLIARDFECS
jgi:endoribonuclease Dicer